MNNARSQTLCNGVSEPLLLRVEEAARIAGVGRSTIYEMVARKQMPGVVKLGRSLRIKRRDLEAWIDGLPINNAAPGTGEPGSDYPQRASRRTNPSTSTGRDL